MIRWLENRRQLREEAEAEERLRGLIENEGRRNVYVPGHVYAVLGQQKVWFICREYGSVPERRPL